MIIEVLILIINVSCLKQNLLSDAKNISKRNFMTFFFKAIAAPASEHRTCFEDLKKSNSRCPAHDTSVIDDTSSYLWSRCCNPHYRNAFGRIRLCRWSIDELITIRCALSNRKRRKRVILVPWTRAWTNKCSPVEFKPISNFRSSTNSCDTNLLWNGTNLLKLYQVPRHWNHKKILCENLECSLRNTCSGIHKTNARISDP